MQGLGELESAVMDVLWQAKRPLAVREVRERLNRKRDLAYTTVMTVLDKLHRKGWAVREMVGRAYEYRASMPQHEAVAQAVRSLLDASADPEGVLLHFTESASDTELTALRRALRRRSSS